MPGRLDLTGQRFGRLVAIRILDEHKSGHLLWECKCDCGNITKVPATFLSAVKRGKGGVKSCGCLKQLPPGEAAFNELYGKYRYSAQVKQQGFKLTKKQFRVLVEQDCYYCGISPYKIYKNPKNLTGFIYNGIDRFDNTKGYIKNNCVPCCQVCNRMKAAYDADYFFNKIKLIYENCNLFEE